MIFTLLYVLIKGDEVLGLYEVRDEALTAGYARFGAVPLLVKQVMPSEPAHHILNICPEAARMRGGAICEGESLLRVY